MRVSDYNIYLPVPDSAETLVVQGAHGSFDLIPSETAAALQQERGQATTSLAGIPTELQDELVARGYLTEKSHAEELDFIHKLSGRLHQSSARRVNLTIMPTYNCNFRCTYCFEQELQKGDKKWLSKTMSTELVDAIFEQVKKLRAEGSVVPSLQLFGGEPLLPTNRDIVRYICRAAAEHNVAIACVSNGFSLDSYLDIMREYPFAGGVQITLDGIGASHDVRRPRAGGQPTYDKIMRNIQLALEAECKITIRTNVYRENLSSVGDLIEEFTRRGWTDLPNFRFYFKATLACFETPENVVTDAEIIEVLTELVGSREKAFGLTSSYGGLAASLSSMLHDRSYAPLTADFCGATTAMYTIDPGGDIYACWDVVSDRQHVIGHVDIDKGTFESSEKSDVWRQRAVGTLDKCRSCQYLFFCGGGCAAQSKVDAFGKVDPFCDGYGEMFDDVALALVQNAGRLDVPEPIESC
jgi:uncharacterized protein